MAAGTCRRLHHLTALLFTGTLFAQSKLLLTLLIGLADWDRAPFTHRGRRTRPGRRQTPGSNCYFALFFGGTIGTALLAALGGFLIAQFGRQSLVAISILNIALALIFVRRLVPSELNVPERTEAAVPERQAQAGWAVAVVLAVLLGAIALRAFSQQAIVTYVPKFQDDLGVSPAVYGGVMSLSWPPWRWECGRLIPVRSAGHRAHPGAEPPGYRARFVGFSLRVLPATRRSRSRVFPGTLAYAAAGLGPTRFPERMAMVSGIFLGFGLSAGPWAWLFGLLADNTGLASTLSLLPIIVLANALLLLATWGAVHGALGQVALERPLKLAALPERYAKGPPCRSCDRRAARGASP